jgi:hypothetical protein
MTHVENNGLEIDGRISCLQLFALRLMFLKVICEMKWVKKFEFCGLFFLIYETLGESSITPCLRESKKAEEFLCQCDVKMWELVLYRYDKFLKRTKIERK